MKEKLNKLEALLSRFYSELEERGYAKSSYYMYRAAGARLIKWCDRNSITEYDEDVGKRFCEYVDVFYKGKRNDKWGQQNIRFVRLLNSLQKGDDFEYRKPNLPYYFRDETLQLVNRFLEYCGASLLLSKTSIRDKRSILSRFDRFLEEEGGVSIKAIDTDIVEHFITSCATQLSRLRFKSTLQQFFRFLYKSEETNVDLSTCILKEPHVAHENKLPTTYSEEEIKLIIGGIDRNSPIGKRDYLILLLAAEYGMRASDISTVRIDQVDWDKNTISIIQRKTRVPVSFPLLSSVGNAIIDYLRNGRPETKCPNIVLRHDAIYKGLPMTSSSIFSAVARAIKRSGIPDWKSRRHGPHSLRHSLATNLLKQSVSIPIISSVLGHKCIESTRVYVGVDIEMLRKCCLDIPELRSSNYYYTKRKML